jgi:parallel beta-helix repeat protein
MKIFQTFAELQQAKVKEGERLVCVERANAEYIVQPNDYVALAGDVTSANGLVGELQIGNNIDISAFGEDFDTSLLDAQSRVGGEAILNVSKNYNSNGVILTGDSLHIVAVGTPIITLADNSNTSLINATNTLKLTLEGLTLECNGANQSSGNGVVCGNETTVLNCSILNASNYGVYGLNKSGVSVEGCVVVDSGNIAIFIQATSANQSEVKVIDNTVNRESLGTSISEGGIKVRGDKALFETRNVRIEGNTVVMPISPTSAAAICIELWGGSPYSTISGNICSGGSMCISIDSSSYTTCVSNIGVNHNKYGIELAGSSNCTVSANSLDGGNLGANSEGIIVSAAGSTNNSIVGNSLIGFTLDGIHVAAGNDCNIVSSNAITHSGNRYGINVQTSDSVVVSANTINGGNSALKGLVIESSSSCVVSGNAIKDFTQHGILLLATSLDVDNTSINGGSIINCNTWIGFQESASALGFRNASFGVVRNGQSYNLLDIKSDVREITGTGNPEGVWSGGRGSVFRRIDAASGAALYIKETGTGNTGWVAK